MKVYYEYENTLCFALLTHNQNKRVYSRDCVFTNTVLFDRNGAQPCQGLYLGYITTCVTQNWVYMLNIYTKYCLTRSLSLIATKCEVRADCVKTQSLIYGAVSEILDGYLNFLYVSVP